MLLIRGYHIGLNGKDKLLPPHHLVKGDDVIMLRPTKETINKVHSHERFKEQNPFEDYKQNPKKCSDWSSKVNYSLN
jgi:hypothetical protein